MPVAVQRWRGSLKHRTVELHGVTAGVEPGAGGSFWISIDRVRATLRLRPRARPRLVIESLTIERPRLRWAVGPVRVAEETLPAEGPPLSPPPAPALDPGRRRRWFELRQVTVDGGELHFEPRSPAALAGAVLGITARLEPADGAFVLDAGAASVGLRGAVLPGVQVTGRVSATGIHDLLDSPVEARWTFGTLARGTLATSALRTEGLNVAGEVRARVEDLASLEWLAGVLAPVLRMASDGLIDVTFRGSLSAAGPRLETLTARLELRG